MVSYDDLSDEAKEVFDKAADDFEGSVDEAARTKYVEGLQRAAESGTYAEGLANKFNMDASDFSGVAGKWEGKVVDADPDEWEDALTAAGIREKFRDNLVTGLTETESE